MKKFTSVSILALALVSGGAAFAQTTPPAAPSTAPAVTAPVAPPAAVKPATPSTMTPAVAPAVTAAPAVTMEPAFEAKFKAADKDGKGFIEGAALDTYKPVMTQVDTNKDGKISRAEFAAAAKAGIIK